MVFARSKAVKSYFNRVPQYQNKGISSHIIINKVRTFFSSSHGMKVRDMWTKDKRVNVRR